MRTAVVVGGLVLATAGCAFPAPPGPAADRNGAVVANGVTVRLPVAGGGLLARARKLEVGSDGGILLSGDASVALDAGCALEARAERIAIDGSAGRAVLQGGVRARFEAPAAAGAAVGTGDAVR